VSFIGLNARVPRLLLVPSVFEDRADTVRWTLNAARDFGAAAALIADARRHDPASVDYIGFLIGALISYSRPFRYRKDADTPQAATRNRYLLDLGTDLGVDLTLHITTLRMRDRLIARSVDPPGQATLRSLKINEPRLRAFEFPNQKLARLAVGLDLDRVTSMAQSMRLACIFLLAEVNPQPPR
jgi:hypothetical protein